MEAVEQKAPTCPGCHFGCAIDAFQCRRGEVFWGKWKAGEELPTRRGPGSVRPPEGDMKLSSDDRIMHLLHIVGIALDDLANESGASEPARRIVDCIMRQGKAASTFVIEGRTHLPVEEIEAQLGELAGQGLVTARETCADTTLHELTDSGLERARTWEAERKAGEARFLSVLSEDEKQQLHDLIFKILEPGFKRRAR